MFAGSGDVEDSFAQTADSATPARRWCRFTETLSRRRRLARLADELIGSHRDRPPIHPETFGLSDDEVRAESRRLFAAGWSVAEIQAVLDVRRESV
jgi:hypothetical protein